MHEVRIIDNTPLIYRNDLIIPCDTISNFPDCCGPGEGIGEKIIPEKILFLKISAACFGHDDDFKYAEPTWNAFHAANSRLLINMLSIINVKSEFVPFRIYRRYRAMTYYTFVDEISICFWNLKRKQIKQGMWEGYTLPQGFNF